MSDQEFIKTLIGTDPTKKPKYIRRHHCNSVRCHLRTVLAYQLTNDLEGSDGDFYQAKTCVWVRGEPEIVYEKRRWFGNTIACPVCGTMTKLLVDKPIAWEKIESSQNERKELNAS